MLAHNRVRHSQQGLDTLDHSAICNNHVNITGTKKTPVGRAASPAGVVQVALITEDVLNNIKL